MEELQDSTESTLLVSLMIQLSSHWQRNYSKARCALSKSGHFLVRENAQVSKRKGLQILRLRLL